MLNLHVSNWLGRLFCLLVFAGLWGGAGIPQAFADTVLPQRVHISLQREESEPFGAPILVLDAPVTSKVCYDVGNLQTKLALTNRAVVVRINGYERRNSSPDNGDCNQNSVAKIRMNPETLKAAQVNVVRFDIGEISDVYSLQLGENAMRIVPQAEPQRVFTDRSMPQLVDPLYFWFIPERTVVLTVANANDPLVGEEIEEFAVKVGMQPLSNVIPNFKPRLKDDNRFFFVDHGNYIFSTLSGDRKESLGTTSYQRMVRKGASSERVIFTKTIYAENITLLD